MKALKESICLHCIDEKSESRLSQKGTQVYFYYFTIITPAASIVAGRI